MAQVRVVGARQLRRDGVAQAPDLLQPTGQLGQTGQQSARPQAEEAEATSATTTAALCEASVAETRISLQRLRSRRGRREKQLHDLGNQLVPPAVALLGVRQAQEVPDDEKRIELN